MQMVPVEFDRKLFDSLVKQLDEEQACALAWSRRDIFGSCFPDDAPAATKPGPAKAKPKAETPPFAEVKDRALEYITKHGYTRSVDVAGRLQLDDGIVRRALLALVKLGKAYQDGTGKGARFAAKPLDGASAVSTPEPAT